MIFIIYEERNADSVRKLAAEWLAITIASKEPNFICIV